jgi:multidrug efflux pump subunit AcrB
MTLPELSIKRHVLAWMMSAVLVLVGVIGYQRIGMDRFPYIEFPVISITTALKGANPDIVDSSITNVIESAVNSVPGIEHVQSTSSPGVSVVNITFALEKKVDVAFNEVQSKVNQVLRRLPKDVDPPVIAKVETNAQPIMWLALQGDRTQQQLNQYALNVLKKRLETIDGVGEVRLGGRRDRTIRVNLLPDRMAAHTITAQDISDAFAREHVQLAGGFVVGQKTESLLKLDLEFHQVGELRGLIVAWRNKAPIRLGDVAEIEDGLTDNRQLARFNGKTTVGLGMVKIANANTVAITERILERVERELRPALPPGMSLSVVSNDAVFILEIVDSLKEHLIEGTLLASLVVWIFLRSVRSTLIIALAIPVSLMGAIAVIYFAGFTLNSLTMLALLLLIGVVVDDAIVVLENIFRHREELDPDPVSAAINGSNEVVFAVMAATLSLVCIFAPVAFISGIIGQFFRSFALVVTFGVLVSLFVSLTLTPMLCARYLRVEKQHGPIYRAFDRLFAGLDAIYVRLLEGALTHRLWVLLATVAVVASSAFFFANVGKAFTPEQDEGRFLVSLRTPLGSSIDYTDSKAARGGSHPRPAPGIRSEFALIGLGTAGQVNQGTVVVRMVPREERSVKQQDVIPLLRKEFSQIAGARVFAAPYPMVQGQRGEPLQFVLTGENLQELGRHAVALQRKLATIPGIGRIDTDLQLDLPSAGLRARPTAHRRRRPEHPGRGPGHQHAHRRRGHRQIQRRARRRPALRHPREGPGRQLHSAGRSVEDLPAQQVGPAGAPRQRGPLPGNPGPGRCRAIRPAIRRHLSTPPRPCPWVRRWSGQAQRRRAAAHGLPGQADRPGRGVRQDPEVHELHLRPGPDPALHGAGQPVQQLPAALHRHAGPAPGHRRRRGGPVGHGPDPQHLLDDRPGAADRPGGQELHPAGGPHQPAPRRRPAGGRRAAQRLPDPDAPGADDLDDGDPGPCPGSAGLWRRQRDQPAAGHRGDRRHGQLDPADPGGGAGGVFAAGRLARTAPGCGS